MSARRLCNGVKWNSSELKQTDSPDHHKLKITAKNEINATIFLIWIIKKTGEIGSGHCSVVSSILHNNQLKINRVVKCTFTESSLKKVMDLEELNISSTTFNQCSGKDTSMWS